MTDLKKLLLLSMLLLCPVLVHSQATTGFHRLSQVISRAPSGTGAQVVPSATIYVTLASSGAAAAIYSDPLLSAPIPNSTVTSDKNGNYGYYVAIGVLVTETISAPGQGNTTNANIGQGGSGSGSIQINTGAGLTGGGNTSPFNIGIDTTIIPELASANTFTAAQNAPSWQVGGVTVLDVGLAGYHGTASGSDVQLSDGTGVNGNCVKFGSNGIITDAGAPCGTGSGGSTAFGSLTGGTNTSAAMVIGSGGSLTVSGSGTNTATGLTGTPNISVANLAGSGSVTFTGIEPVSTSCLQISSSGVVTSTGSSCAAGGGSGTAAQFAWYSSSGTTVVGNTHFTDSGSKLISTEPVSATNFQIGSTIVLPVGLLGYFGGAANYVQLSDATGVNGDCAKFGSGGVLSDSGAPCGGGGGSSAFASLTGGTNTAAAMLVGTGASLGPTGSGTVTANAITGTPNVSFGNIAGSGTVTFTGIEPASTSCLQISSAGVVSNTGSSCAAGGGSGTANQFAWYSSSGTISVGNSHLTDSGSVITSTEAFNAPSHQVGGVTVLPSGLLGYHGGATDYVQLSDGTGTNGNCVKFGAGGVITDAGSTCGSAGGFGTLTGGTNSSAAMVVGTGASLAPSGSGTVTANAITGTPNISITNILGSGSVTFTGLESVSGFNCLQINSSGVISNTGGTCGGGGGGSGTVGQLAWYASSGTTSVGNTDITDSGGNINFAKALVVNDGTGLGGYLNAGLGNSPTATGSNDILWADSTSSRWKINNVNQGALFLIGLATAGTSGDCVQLAANGIDVVDSGTGCAGAMGTAPGAAINDSGAGSGPTLTTISGSTDGAGWIQVLTGSTPAASAGVVTIPYGGSYTKTPRCVVSPANPAASALSGNAAVYIPQNTSTTAHFVIQVGSTALAAATTYVWRWGCQL